MNHYELQSKVLEDIKEIKDLQLNIAMAMGNTQMAIIMDLNRQGRAMASNYDALKYLENYYGVSVGKLRKKV
jgi:hypothetical protein